MAAVYVAVCADGMAADRKITAVSNTKCNRVNV